MMKSYFLKILLFLSVFTKMLSGLYAQVPTDTDSIKNLIKSAKTDSALGYIYDALAREYGHTDPDAGLKYGRKGLVYCRKSHIYRYEVDALNTLGMMHRFIGNFDSSLYFHHAALDLTQRKKLGDKILERTYSFLNLAYTEQGNYTAGLEYGFKFLKMRAIA